jgi:hypothetical protein
MTPTQNGPEVIGAGRGAIRRRTPGSQTPGPAARRFAQRPVHLAGGLPAGPAARPPDPLPAGRPRRAAGSPVVPPIRRQPRPGTGAPRGPRAALLRVDLPHRRPGCPAAYPATARRTPATARRFPATARRTLEPPAAPRPPPAASRPSPAASRRRPPRPVPGLRAASQPLRTGARERRRAAVPQPRQPRAAPTRRTGAPAAVRPGGSPHGVATSADPDPVRGVRDLGRNTDRAWVLVEGAGAGRRGAPWSRSSCPDEAPAVASVVAQGATPDGCRPR